MRHCQQILQEPVPPVNRHPGDYRLVQTERLPPIPLPGSATTEQPRRNSQSRLDQIAQGSSEVAQGLGLLYAPHGGAPEVTQEPTTSTDTGPGSRPQNLDAVHPDNPSGPSSTGGTPIRQPSALPKPPRRRGTNASVVLPPPKGRGTTPTESLRVASHGPFAPPPSERVMRSSVQPPTLSMAEMIERMRMQAEGGDLDTPRGRPTTSAMGVTPGGQQGQPSSSAGGESHTSGLLHAS